MDDKTNTATPNSKVHFRLFDLPAELRCLIYEYALGAPVCLDHKYLLRWSSNHKCDSVAHGQVNEYPPLLLTCRRLHHEAEKVWLPSMRLDYAQASVHHHVNTCIGKERLSKIECMRMVDVWSIKENARIFISRELSKLRAGGYSGVLEALYEDASGKKVVLSRNDTARPA